MVHDLSNKMMIKQQWVTVFVGDFESNLQGMVARRTLEHGYTVTITSGGREAV
jgi:hypothetical protein